MWKLLLDFIGQISSLDLFGQIRESGQTGMQKGLKLFVIQLDSLGLFIHALNHLQRILTSK